MVAGYARRPQRELARPGQPCGMTDEGGVGVLAGVQAHTLGVVTRAAISFMPLASLIVVWRFSGRRIFSETSEARAQMCVAASFFLLVPFIAEAIRKLINGQGADATVLAIAVTASVVVLMPALEWAKLRFSQRLDSGATAGEGVQNLMTGNTSSRKALYN
jgi:hypothetical protein